MIYSEIPSAEIIEKTLEAVRSRGIKTELAANGEDALVKLKALIPAGSDVMTGSSTTLAQIGFEDMMMSGGQPWNYLKEAVLQEDDPERKYRLRRQATLSDYFLGSVHAISQTGEIVIASGSGSQIPAYAYSSPNVIWVAGAQKITPSLEEAFKRVREYVLPLEDARMKRVNGPSSGSLIGKLLVFEYESGLSRRNITLILVRETLGF